MADSNSESRKLTTSGIIRMLTKYREKECLWNMKHPDYKNKRKRNEAYEEVAKAMNMPDVEETKKRIKSIRDTYNIERNKSIKLAGTGNEYTTKLRWFSVADEFLSKRNCEPFSLNNVQRGEQEEPSGDDFVEDHSFMPEFVPKRPKLARRGKRRLPFKIASARPPSEVSFPFAIASARPPRYKDREQHSEPMQDEFYYFGMNIASQLRMLPQIRALQLQASIQQMLLQERIELEKGKSPEDPFIPEEYLEQQGEEAMGEYDETEEGSGSGKRKTLTIM